MYIYNEYLDGNMAVEEQKVCVMKRSGERVLFDRSKIAEAIQRASATRPSSAERRSVPTSF